MINKKIVAVKEGNDLRRQVIQTVSALPADRLSEALSYMKALQARSSLGVVLESLGRVYEVPFTDGRKTLSVILTHEGIRSLGIDLNSIFKGSGGREVFNEQTDVKNGVLVNLDLYQQVTILRAIIVKKPELQDVLGLYNLRGSRKVYEVLSRAGIPSQLNIWWMWTAERYVSNQSEANYPEEGIVVLPKLTTLKGYRFANRDIVNDYWYNDLPDLHNDYGAAVFGAQG